MNQPPAAAMAPDAGPGSIRARRELAIVVLGCLSAGGALLFAASRTWLVEVITRPEPLPALRTPQTGTDLSPVLPALAWVAMAAGIALVATRGAGRLVVCGLLAVTGVAASVVAVDAAAGRADLTWWWPLVCVLAGAIIAQIGIVGLRRGRRWPAMGARYARPDAAPVTPTANPAVAANLAASAAQAPVSAAAPATGANVGAVVGDGYAAGWWEAIERGEDPTADS